jgi:hypothetical protein
VALAMAMGSLTAAVVLLGLRLRPTEP